MRQIYGKARVSVKRSSAGLGLFAVDPIKKGDFVIEYTGDVISNEEADRRGGKYLFEVNDKWTIDGKGRENQSRYINHSCRPNCEPHEIRGRIRIYAKKNIKPGEEITYNYGDEYFDDFIKKSGCQCNACAQKAARPTPRKGNNSK